MRLFNAPGGWMRLNTDRVVSLTAMLVGLGIRQDPHDFYLEARPDAGGEAAPALVAKFLELFELGEVPDSWYRAVGAPRSGPDKAIVEVTYRSVYGDRWHVTSDRVVPEPL